MSSLKETALLLKRIYGGRLIPHCCGYAQFPGVSGFTLQSVYLAEGCIFIGHFIQSPSFGTVVTGPFSLGGVSYTMSLPSAEANYSTINSVSSATSSAPFSFVGYVLDRR